MVKKVLLLGMVFSEEKSPKRGQEYRDRVRCEGLETHGYEVYTLDDKHADSAISSGRHCTANFAGERRMMKSIDSKWGDIMFDDIILDYFFSPVGWARERWSDTMFTDTFPSIARKGLLKKGGKILIPNLNYTEDKMAEFESILSQFYIIRTMSDPKDNVLYLATETCKSDLLKCPDNLTNETQVAPLLNHSNHPFYTLELREEFISPVVSFSTPPKRGRTQTSTSVESVPIVTSKKVKV